MTWNEIKTRVDAALARAGRGGADQIVHIEAVWIDDGDDFQIVDGFGNGLLSVEVFSPLPTRSDKETPHG